MRSLTTFFVFLIAHFVQAQSVEVDSEENFEANRAHVFAPLDLSEVTSGLLYDYSVQMIPLDRFDGVTLDDTTKASEIVFGLAYATLYSAALTPADQLPHPDLYMNWSNSYQKDQPIPMALLLQDYHRFKKDGLENNLIDTLNAQLHDVPGRTESPYLRDTTFMASPLLVSAPGTDFTIMLPSELLFNNLTASIQSMQIDFNDGLGWRALDPNKKVNVSYSSGGAKTIVIKCILSDGSEWLSHSTISVPENIVASKYGEDPDRNILFEATDEHDGGTLNLFYGCGELDPREPFTLRRPVLVIEGADPPQNGNSHTWRSMQRLLDTVIANVSEQSPWDIMSDNNVDLLYLDFNNGNDDMRRNAELVKDVIHWINEQKAEDGPVEQNIVIGVSMGGPVGKWALLEMEANGEDHQTRSYMAFDAPMRGNNFSLGMQHMFKHTLNAKVLGIKLKNYSQSLKEMEDILFNTSNKQLLFYHAYGTQENGYRYPEHDEFYGQLAAKGGFQEIEYLALVNGSQLGEPQLIPPGARMFHANLKTLEIFQLLIDFNSGFLEGATEIFLTVVAHILGFHEKLEYEVWALPERNNPDFKKIYHGRINIFAFHLPIGLSYKTVKTRGFIPYDSAPGANNNVILNTLSGINGADVFYDAHCFVPTVSALDLVPPNDLDIFFPVHNNDALVAAGVTTLDRFFASSNDDVITYGTAQHNQEHPSLNEFNAVFLLEEVIGSTELEEVSNINSRIFNFANRINRYIKNDLVVENTGKLWVNRSGEIGFVGEGNPLNPSGTNYDLIIGTGGCEGEGVTVTIQNGGEFEIGQEAPVSNTSNVYITDGSTVLIKDGGEMHAHRYSKIIVRDDSRLKIEAGGRLRLNHAELVVEEGATLEIDEDAMIDLWWHFSNIHIEEGAHLIYNGPFKFDGYGYFLFDKDHLFTQNAKLVLSGQYDRFIRLNNGAVLEINHHGIDLSNGEVEYYGHSSIKTAPGARVEMSLMNFEGIGSAPDNSVALDIKESSFAFITNCSFEELHTGIIVDNTNLDLPTHIWNSTFTDLTLGISAYQTPGILINGCTFDNTNLPGGMAIDLWDMASAGVNSSTVIGHSPTVPSIGAITAKNVDELYFNGNTITDNNVGLSIIDVPILRVYGGLIAHHSNAGILVPPIGDGSDNESNIFLYSQAKVNENNIGIHFEAGGGTYDNSTDLFGMLTLDCAELFNNDVGVLGDDVILNIDAFINTNPDDPTDPTLVRSNKIHGIGLYFDICYSDLEDEAGDLIPASGNYWGGTTDIADLTYKVKIKKSSVGTGCATFGHFMDFGIMVAQEPVGCNEPPRDDIPTTPHEVTEFPVFEIDIAGFTENPNKSCTLNSVIDPKATDELHFDGYNLYRAGRYDEAKAVFGTTATVSESERQQASGVCKHYINVAKVLGRGYTPSGDKKPLSTRPTIHKAGVVALSVHPNPAQTVFQINTDREAYELKIFDINGRAILEGSYSRSVQINSADWISGWYFIELYDVEQQETLHTKIIIQ